LLVTRNYQAADFVRVFTSANSPNKVLTAVLANVVISKPAGIDAKEVAAFFPEVSYILNYMGVYQGISVDNLKDEKWPKFTKTWQGILTA
jgi:hypothetical protein